MKKLLISLGLLGAAILLFALFPRPTPIQPATPPPPKTPEPQPAPEAIIETPQKEPNTETKSVLSPADVAQIEKGRRFTYERAIRGLHLSSDEERQLWRYLIGRTEAAYIAKKVAIDLNEKDYLRRTVDLAFAQVDAEAKAQMSPALFETAQLLVRATPYLYPINQTYSNAFAAGNEPLPDNKIVPLARAFLSTYGTPNNPLAQPELAGVNDEGLMAIDADLLDKASLVLTPSQLRIFRNALAERNKRIVAASPQKNRPSDR